MPKASPDVSSSAGWDLRFPVDSRKKRVPHRAQPSYIRLQRFADLRGGDLLADVDDAVVDALRVV